MPGTLSRTSESESLYMATGECPAATVRRLDRTRTDADGPIPTQLRKARPTGPHIDIVEEWGVQSFPASDPPMNW